MEIFSLAFIVIMVVLSGAIAYFGDVIGRKIGKKKLKIWKLRPKHTAAIATGLFGALTTLIGIIILAESSEQVRVWILEGNKARTELVATQKKLQGLQGDLEGTNAKLTKSINDLTKSTKQNAEISKKNAELGKKTGELQSSINQLQASIGGLKNKLDSANSQLASVKGENSKVQAEFLRSKKNNAEILKINKDVQKQNLQLMSDNQIIQRDAEKLKGEIAGLKKERDDLEALRKELEEQLVKVSDNQKIEFAKRAKELEEAEGKLDSANRELANIQSQLSILRIDLENSNQGLLSSRINPMIFSMQDELARVPVPTRLNQTEARALLLGAIDRASQTAAARGASPVPGSQDFVSFIQRPSNQGQVSADAQFKAVSAALEGAGEPKLLILRTLFNTFRGEYIPLDAIVAKNPVIYKQGEMIFEFRVDGHLTDSEIANKISDTVRGPLREKVLKDGLIPAIGTEKPLGEISNDVVLKMVQQIRASQVVVRVQLLAATQIRAGDPLKVDFRLR